MSYASELDEQLRAANIPITGVSVPDEGNPATWVIHFAPEATQSERDAGQAILAAFTPPTPNTLFDKFAEVRLNEKALRAWAKALHEAIPAPVTNWNDTKARAKQIYKNGNGS